MKKAQRRNQINTKGDVTTRARWNGTGVRYPALNVKIYKWPDTYVIAGRFNLTDAFNGFTEALLQKYTEQAIEAKIDRAIQWALEANAAVFWEDFTSADEIAEYFPRRRYGSRISAESDGRSGGWLVVRGLPDVDSWDAIDLSYWRRFAKHVDTAIAWFTDTDNIVELIEINEWLDELVQATKLSPETEALVSLVG